MRIIIIIKILGTYIYVRILYAAAASAGLNDSDEDDDLDEEEAASLPPMPVIDSVRLRSGRRAVQRVCFGFDDEFEDQLKEAMKQSAISASDRRRLSEEAAADGADDGEEEEAIDAEAGSAD